MEDCLSLLSLAIILHPSDLLSYPKAANHWTNKPNCM